MKRCYKKSFIPLMAAFAVTFASILVFSFNQPARAQPTSACDPEYMDALEAKAWMEAQREISQNQNLIAKPDSVLEYSCFDRFLRELADHTDDMFSDTAYWSSVVKPTSIEFVLDDLVGDALASYLNANFNHPYINARIPVDYTPALPVSAGNYNLCDQMARAWESARCLSFQNQPPLDGFFTLDWYITNDPRQLPGGSIASCTPPTTPDPAATWQTAYNGEPAPYQISNEPVADGTPYEEDPVLTFLDLLRPASSAGDCSPPIPTGITVKRSGFSPASYLDGVCPNPGCYYQPSGAGLGTCTK